jgi:hypothetical protein
MRPYAYLIAEALRRAGQPGPTAVPRGLLDALSAFEKPTEILFDSDKASEVFETLHQEVPFLRQVAFGHITVLPAHVEECAALVRWLIEAFVQWRADAADAPATVAAIIVVAQTCDGQHQFWTALPNSLGTNAAILKELARHLGSLAVQFSARGPDVPIWECEAVQALLDAEAAESWSDIGERWRPFDTAFFPNAVQMQAARCLCRYDIETLANVLQGVRQTAVAMMIGACLTISDRCKLAAAASNFFVQFACVYRVVTDRYTQGLDAEARAALEVTLLNVAADGSRWEDWLRFFNAYPVRYPTLQVSLGRVLAAAPLSTLQAYVSSLVLQSSPVTQPGLSREEVAECLGAFRNHADLERRKRLWTLAHERWRAWNFDDANAGTHLADVHRSVLDYALVGYAVECLSHVDLRKAMDDVQRELETVGDVWHASITDIVSSWNRCLSRLQPYAHANEVVSKDKAWLTESEKYLPFDPRLHKYQALKFHMYLPP